MFKKILALFFVVGILFSHTTYAASTDPKANYQKNLLEVQEYTKTEAYQDLRDAKAANSYDKLPIQTPGEKTKEIYGKDLTPELIQEVLKSDKGSLNKRRSSMDTPVLHAGSGAGNSLSMSLFYYGDMVVLKDPSCSFFIVSCYWSHIATYDMDYDDGTESAFTFWSAYPTGAAPSDNSSSPYSVNGKVGRQSTDSIHDYDTASAIYVPGASGSELYDVTVYLYNQRGEDYSTTTTKTSTTKWYCSKLPYRAYYTEAGINIDYDGGYYVLPDDVYLDSSVSIFEVAY